MECNSRKALCEMLHAKIIKSQVIDFSPNVSRFRKSFQWNRSGAFLTRLNQIMYLFAVINMVKLSKSEKIIYLSILKIPNTVTS